MKKIVEQQFDIAIIGAGIIGLSVGLELLQWYSVHVCNVPSPAATASLAIAATVADFLVQDFTPKGKRVTAVQ